MKNLFIALGLGVCGVLDVIVAYRFIILFTMFIAGCVFMATTISTVGVVLIALSLVIMVFQR